ncbi:beta-lactamase-like protein [Haematococcus lacustris]
MPHAEVAWDTGHVQTDMCPACGIALDHLEQREQHVERCIEALMGNTQLSEGEEDAVDEKCNSCEEDDSDPYAHICTQAPRPSQAAMQAEHDDGHMLEEEPAVEIEHRETVKEQPSTSTVETHAAVSGCIAQVPSPHHDPRDSHSELEEQKVPHLAEGSLAQGLFELLTGRLRCCPVTCGEWLSGLGLAHLLPLFMREGMDELTLPWLTEQDLVVRGHNRHWVLTHFHADHYRGLTKSFSLGKVVCSAVTAQLVSTKLRVPMSNLLVLPMNQAVEVADGVSLTLVDANHCPGAAMVIATAPGMRPVLHTGDCRLSSHMFEQPELQALRGSRCRLVLDTTYCDPQYCFPSQEETLRYTLEAVKAEAFNPRCLFVFGTYTIGKERLFLEVARALNKKVYVNKEKMQILSCCNLAPDYMRLLTTNHMETNLHAVPLFKVNMEGLGAIMAGYNGRYSTVVGVQPTGWAMERSKGQGPVAGGRRVAKGSVVLHKVPYSEHSSFRELHDFVSWLQPGEILPSVSNDQGPKLAAMLAALQNPLPRSAMDHGPAALGMLPISSFMGRNNTTGPRHGAEASTSTVKRGGRGGARGFGRRGRGNVGGRGLKAGQGAAQTAGPRGATGGARLDKRQRTGDDA